MQVFPPKMLQIPGYNAKLRKKEQTFEKKFPLLRLQHRIFNPQEATLLIGLRCLRIFGTVAIQISGVVFFFFFFGKMVTCEAE